LFNRGYATVEAGYYKGLNPFIKKRFFLFSFLVVLCVLIVVLVRTLPGGFIPVEDQGVIYVNVTTPSGATLERTEEVMDKIDAEARHIAAVEAVSILAGFSLFTDGSGASFGMAMLSLKPWNERKESVDDVIALLTERTKNIKGASIQYFPPPAVPGYGNSSGFELRIQDKSGTATLPEIQRVAERFVASLNHRPEIRNTFTSYNASFPQYLISVDYDKAAQLGVTVDDAMENLQSLIGSYYATNFIRFGQLYKVMLQALPKYRAQPEDLLKLYVKNERGKMVPYSAFMNIDRVYGPEQLTRYNMFNSAMINGEPAPGYSSGTAIEAIKEVAAKQLPSGYEFDWSGMTRDEVKSGNQSFYVFLICLVFVYLLLAAQYESFLLPMPVLLSLPTGIFGAFAFLWMFGLENNIYAQVAMIMLIGLLGKNAILIVEFATIRHREGMSAFDAAVEGAKIRLRPILMTSFAFIAGLIPLMFSTGAGSIGNRTIGTAAAGGMFFGTVFGLVVIPGLYVVFASLSEKFTRPKTGEEIALTEKI
jgi:HAE1 family hydrophobic/amphiphilic exporter-1